MKLSSIEMSHTWPVTTQECYFWQQATTIFKFLIIGNQLPWWSHKPLSVLPEVVLGTGDWGLGTGDWELGTGDWGLGTGSTILKIIYGIFSNRPLLFLNSKLWAVTLPWWSHKALSVSWDMICCMKGFWHKTSFWLQSENISETMC